MEFKQLGTWHSISLIKIIIKLIEAVIYNRIIVLLNNCKYMNIQDFAEPNSAYRIGFPTHNYKISQLNEDIKVEYAH